MNTPEFTNLETRLAQELEQEVRAAMAATDTARELARFQTATRRRTTRARIIAAAAVLCLVAGGGGTVALIAQGSTMSSGPALARPVGKVPTHHLIAHSTGPVAALPTDVPVTTLKGPQNLGTLAFGDLWATTGRVGVKVLPTATLYRISAAGSQVLSTASYPQINDNQPDPVQAGNSIIVANRSGSYTVFDRTGRKVGTLASTSTLGAVAGNAFGGWIATGPRQVAHLDATGTRIDRTLSLPLRDISGLAISPGTLWITDETLDQLVRVNTATGTITGRTQLAFAPIQVRYIGGAVYVASEDDYGLHRIDPSTMALTATTVGSSDYDAQPTILPSYNGQVWTQALGGTITQLNPVTLRTELTTRVFSELSDITNGAVIGATRIYVVDGIADRLYSYPNR